MKIQYNKPLGHIKISSPARKFYSSKCLLLMLKRTQIKYLVLWLKKFRKAIKPRSIRWKENIKIKAPINRIKAKKMIQKLMILIAYYLSGEGGPRFIGPWLNYQKKRTGYKLKESEINRKSLQ